MLEVYNDKIPVVLTLENKKEVMKKISELYDLLEFLYQNVDDDNIDNNVVNTSMSLYESYYRELATLLEYNTILEKENQERHAKIRQKNNVIRALTEQLGKQVSPQAVTGAIRLYDDILRAWYKNEGFHYASMTPGTYGFSIELSDEMNYNQNYTIDDQKSEIQKIIWEQDKNTMQKKNSGWDIDPDKYHASLLDTDNNREKIQVLISSDFPNAHFNGFESRHNDNNLFALRTKCFIPYLDIADYYKKMIRPHAND